MMRADAIDTAIFGPFFAMIALTLIVWVVMYVRRTRHLISKRIHPQRLATPEKVAGGLPEWVNNPSNNLKNLFELPVIFYTLCLYLFVTASVDLTYVVAAWVFVGFRALHSMIHCTSNRVMNRFRAYALAALALWFMALRAGLSFLANGVGT